MTDTAPKLAFESKEEFRHVCQSLSARLGYLNRVSMGESRFVIEIHNLLSQVGRVFDEHLNNPDTKAAFGDGYTAGTIPRRDQSKALFDLLYPPK